MSKLSYLLTFLISLSIIGCDNEITSSQVPSIVENTFKSHFPNARDVEWETLSADYEVSFELKNIDHDALLDSSGNLLKYKYEIEETELPEIIKSFLEQEYPQEKWDDPELIIDGNSEYYQLKLDGFFNDKKIVITSLGKVLSNTKYWN